MTPAEVYAAALERYKDPELAMRLAARAEGIMGKGKAPDNAERQKRRDNGRQGAETRMNGYANLESRNAAMKAQGKSRRQMILDALANGPMTKDEIVAATGIPQTTVGNAIYQLRNEGKIYSLGQPGKVVAYHLAKVT